MALKVSAFASNVLDYKVVYQSDATGTVDSNVTGSSGRLYSIDIDNGNNGSQIEYFRVTLDTETVTSGTTIPDMCIRVKGGERKWVEIPGGIPFTYLSFWCTSEDAESSTQTNPTSDVLVTLVTT